MAEPIIPKFFPGWKPSLPDQRDHLYTFSGAAVLALPAKVDLRTPKVSVSPIEPNWNQTSLGSCGPHSSGLNIAYNLLADSKPPLMPSRLFIYYFTRVLMGTVNQDSGVDNRSMLRALATYGFCDESLWPYDINRYQEKPPQAAIDQAATRKIKEYLAVPQDLTQMKACLAGDRANGVPGRPFIFGFVVYESFTSAQVARTGDVPMPTMREKQLGGHDVCIDGYDDATQSFDFENSYGESWGKGGRGRIPYAYATNQRLAQDFWTVRGSGDQPLPPITPPEPPSANNVVVSCSDPESLKNLEKLLGGKRLILQP